MLNMIMRLCTYDLKQFPADFVEILWNSGVLIKRMLAKSLDPCISVCLQEYTSCAGATM